MKLKSLRWPPPPWLLAFLGFGVLSAVLLVRSKGYAADDAYIFYRYARNIGSGTGWQFNPGQQTANAATSPLWAAVLSTVGVVFGYGPAVGQAVYALCLAGAATVLYRLFAGAGASAAGLIGGVLLLFNPVLLSTWGMESALFVLLALGLLWADRVGRSEILVGILGGALILARPEGAMLVAVLWLFRWVRSTQLPWRRTAALVASVVPWVVFSIYAFGSPVAETLAAKSAQGRSGYFGPRYAYLRYIEVVLREPWSALLLATAVIGALILAHRMYLSNKSYDSGIIGRVRHLLDDPISRCLLAAGVFGLLQTVGYGLAIRPPAYAWYYATPYLTLTVFSAFALGSAVDWLRTWSAREESTNAALRRVVAIVGVATLALTIPTLMTRRHMIGNQLCGYSDAGDWLAAHADKGSTVSAAEIGMLGWRSKLEIVDYLGLLDSTAADEIGRGDLGSWFLRTKPDYYVAHIPTWWLEVPSINSEEFKQHYRPRVENPVVGWSAVRVYERIDPADASSSGGADSARPILSPELLAALTKRGISLDATQLDALADLLGNYVADPVAQLNAEIPAGVNFDALHRYDTKEKSPRLAQWTVLGTALDGFVAPLGGKLPRHAC